MTDDTNSWVKFHQLNEEVFGSLDSRGHLEGRLVENRVFLDSRVVWVVVETFSEIVEVDHSTCTDPTL